MKIKLFFLLSFLYWGVNESLFAEDIKKKDLRVDEPTPILFPANPDIQASVSCHIMTLFFDNFEELAILDIIDATTGVVVYTDIYLYTNNIYLDVSRWCEGQYFIEVTFKDSSLFGIWKID